MDKIDQLFVRACKSENPDVRLKSVYRRFYGNYEHNDSYIANILMSLTEKYNIISVKQCLVSMDPSKYMYYGCTKNDEYYTVVKRMLTSKIRLSSIEIFGCMSIPSKIKNNK